MYVRMVCDILGWMNRLGNPRISTVELNKTSNSMFVNVTWPPPEYLGGLNMGDIYYQLTTSDHSINTADTYSLLSYDKSTLYARNVIIAVHYSGSMANTLYIPHKVSVMKHRIHLKCAAVGEQRTSS